MNKTKTTIQESIGYISPRANLILFLIFMGSLMFITILIGYVVKSFNYTIDSNINSSGLGLVILGLLLMITAYTKLYNYNN